MGRKTTYPRNAQIDCPLLICAMNRRCEQRENCADGTGYMLIKKHEKPLYKPKLPKFDMPVMKRVKCCMSPPENARPTEPCPSCPRIPF